MVQLEQEVAQVQVNPELEMIYQESRVDADNGVLIAKHKTMYAAEYEKLNQLREKLKMARERCLPLTNLESRKALGQPPDSVIAAFLVATDVNPPSEVLAAIRDHQVSLWGGQYALGDGKAGYAAVMKVLKKLQEIRLDTVEVRGIGLSPDRRAELAPDHQVIEEQDTLNAHVERLGEICEDLDRYLQPRSEGGDLNVQLMRGERLLHTADQVLDKIRGLLVKYPDNQSLYRDVKCRKQECKEKIEAVLPIVADLKDTKREREKAKDRVEDSKLRNLPLTRLPQWKGDLTRYLSWKEEVLALAVHPVETQRCSAIRGSLAYDEAKTLVSACTTIKSMFQRLDRRYGDKLTLTPMLIKKAQKLPKFPTEIEVENTNISVIEDVRAQLILINMQHELSVSVIYDLEQKLSDANYRMWKTKVVVEKLNDLGARKLDGFFAFLETVRDVNVTLVMDHTPKTPPDKMAGHGHGDGGGKGNRDGEPYRGRGREDGRTGNYHAGGDGQGGRVLKCDLCLGQDHPGRRCQQLELDKMDHANIHGIFKGKKVA
jgi:hypothetical protein